MNSSSACGRMARSWSSGSGSGRRVGSGSAKGRLQGQVGDVWRCVMGHGGASSLSEPAVSMRRGSACWCPVRYRPAPAHRHTGRIAEVVRWTALARPGIGCGAGADATGACDLTFHDAVGAVCPAMATCGCLVFSSLTTRWAVLGPIPFAALTAFHPQRIARLTPSGPSAPRTP